jgi:hypothetical protein
MNDYMVRFTLDDGTVVQLPCATSRGALAAIEAVTYPWARLGNRLSSVVKVEAEQVA